MHKYHNKKLAAQKVAWEKTEYTLNYIAVYERKADTTLFVVRKTEDWPPGQAFRFSIALFYSAFLNYMTLNNISEYVGNCQ